MAQAIPLIIAGVGQVQKTQAAKIEAIERDVESKQAETAAAAREADRKERLAKAVASQAAGTGASLIAFEGSPLTVLEEDIQREEQATERDILSTRIEQLASGARSRIGMMQAKSGAALSLFESGYQASKTAKRNRYQDEG